MKQEAVVSFRVRLRLHHVREWIAANLKASSFGCGERKHPSPHACFVRFRVACVGSELRHRSITLELQIVVVCSLCVVGMEPTLDAASGSCHSKPL